MNRPHIAAMRTAVAKRVPSGPVARIGAAVVGAVVLLGGTWWLLSGDDLVHNDRLDENLAVIAVTPDAQDGQPGSLRAAIEQANNDGIGTQIDLGSGTYNLKQGCSVGDEHTVVPISDEMPPTSDNSGGDLATPFGTETLVLSGDRATIVQACPKNRILHHQGRGTLLVDGVEFRNGNAAQTTETDPASGGAILSDGGAPVMIIDSAFVGNHAATTGGALSVAGPPVKVRVISTTMAGNSAGAGAGAAEVIGTLDLRNSTISHNSAGTHGGVVATTISLDFATVVDNVAVDGTSGQQLATASLTSFGSVVSGGQGTLVACDVGRSRSTGWNLSDDASCGFGDGPGDRDDVSGATIGQMAQYRNWSQLRMPMRAGPLVDAIPTNACTRHARTDQLGDRRPFGSACDVGAVELSDSMDPTAAVYLPATPAIPAKANATYTG